jgi:hypothetical protein
VLAVSDYEKTQESLAMLTILAQSEQEIAAGKTVSADDAFDQLRQKCGAGKTSEN